MIIPDTENVVSLKRILIGEVTKEQEHTITLLKSAQLINKVWDKKKVKGKEGGGLTNERPGTGHVI